MIKECPMRHKNGNCLPIGGFCLSVNEDICKGLMQAYECGKRADVVEQKKGKWIWKDREVNRYRKETGTTADGEVITITVHDNYLQKINYCPVCGKRGDDTFMNYCPNCGADMREENINDQTN